MLAKAQHNLHNPNFFRGQKPQPLTFSLPFVDAFRTDAWKFFLMSCMPLGPGFEAECPPLDPAMAPPRPRLTIFTKSHWTDSEQAECFSREFRRNWEWGGPETDTGNSQSAVFKGSAVPHGPHGRSSCSACVGGQLKLTHHVGAKSKGSRKLSQLCSQVSGEQMVSHGKMESWWKLIVQGRNQRVFCYWYYFHFTEHYYLESLWHFNVFYCSVRVVLLLSVEIQIICAAYFLRLSNKGACFLSDYSCVLVVSYDAKPIAIAWERRKKKIEEENDDWKRRKKKINK